MKLSFTVSLDDKMRGVEVLGRKLLSRFQRQSNWGVRWMLPALAGVFWLGLIGHLVMSWLFGDAIAVESLLRPVGVVCLFTACAVFVRRLPRMALASLGPGPFPMTAHATTDEFVFCEGTQEVRLGWTGIAWLIDDKDGLAFHFPPHGNIWMPNHAFKDDAERVAWKTFIEARVADAERLRGDA